MKVNLILVLASLLLLGCSDEDENSNEGGGTADVGGDNGSDSGGDISGDTAPDADAEDLGVPGCTGEVGSLTLGSIEIDASGNSGPVTFEIPECVFGFVVMINGDENATYIIHEMTNPDDELLVDPNAPLEGLEAMFLGEFGPQFKSPNRVTQAEGLALAMVPNNPAIEAVPGEYTFVLRGVTLDMTSGASTPWQGTVEGEVIWKVIDTIETGGNLDVNLYFSGASDLTAASAPDDSFLQAAIADLTDIYAGGGITIGTVTYQDIAESYRTVDSIMGAGNELNQLFAESAGAEPGMNYFFVDRFETGMGGGIGGIAGGIPGPAFTPGTVRSGVAVAVTITEGDSSILAHIMAHEGGHYLGLFHTVEMMGSTDQLPDTSEGQEDATNLMYPTVGGDTTITPQQSRVIHNHPEVAP